MTKIIIALGLFVTVALVFANAENRKIYACEGYYGCENCCPNLGSGCGKSKTGLSWVSMYQEVCYCSCPDGVTPQTSESIRELDIWRDSTHRCDLFQLRILLNRQYCIKHLFVRYFLLVYLFEFFNYCLFSVFMLWYYLFLSNVDEYHVRIRVR